MPATIEQDRPIRAGVFHTVADAQEAIAGLMNAGFKPDQISVVCSNENIQRQFGGFEQQDVHGTVPAKSIAAGGSVGVLTGGLSVAMTAVSTGQMVLWMAGPLAALAGGVIGSFIGAMMSRGVEKELANYYQQAIAEGKILVAVEEHGPNRSQRLAHGATILSRAGAIPLPLPEG
jgi:hypothetical protein